MEYKDWLEKIKGKINADKVQVRMMSTGNELLYSQPKYGLYLVNEADKDPMDLNATAFSSLGGGFIRTADIEFTVNNASIIGYYVKRKHGNNGRERQIVGYNLTKRRADKVAYRMALNTAKELAQLVDASVEDRTSEDFKDLSEYYEILGLEERVHDFKNRVKT